jgi:hypothetical protein
MKMTNKESKQTCKKVAVAWRVKLSQAVGILGPGREQEGAHRENKRRSVPKGTKYSCGTTYASHVHTCLIYREL